MKFHMGDGHTEYALSMYLFMVVSTRFPVGVAGKLDSDLTSLISLHLRDATKSPSGFGIG